MTIDKILAILYGLCGVAAFIGYVPQVWRLWHDKTRAASTSLVTWAWWSMSSTVALLYSVIVVKDIPFILMSISNFIGCFAVYGMAMMRRYGKGPIL